MREDCRTLYIGYNLELVSISIFNNHYKVVIRDRPGFFERKFKSKKTVDHIYISVEKTDRPKDHYSFFNSEGEILGYDIARAVSGHIVNMDRDKRREEIKQDLKKLYSEIVNEEKK